MDISVIGAGNVGLKLLEIFGSQQSKLKDQTGESIRIVSVSDSQNTVYSESGISIRKVIESKGKGDLTKSGHTVIPFDDIFSLNTGIIVDVSSATPDGLRGRERYLKAFREEKHIVTANKAPLALHWKQIMEESRRRGRSIRYESTVAGGLPLFNLKDFSLMPSEITAFRGIVSSSVNIVLEDLLRGKDFQSSVEYAISEGIAESNYHDDTLGTDAARKTVILSNALFGTSVTLNDLNYEGVEGNDEKIKSLRSEKGKFKVISEIISEDGQVRAFSGIRKLEPGDPLEWLKSHSLGYEMSTDRNGDIIVVGMKDTPLETASGVVNDVAIITRTEK